MARPPRRESFRPGGESTEPDTPDRDLAEAQRVATQFDQASRNRRARDRVEGEDIPDPVKLEPETTARGLPPSVRPGASNVPVQVTAAAPERDPLRPFASYAPESGELGDGMEQSQNDSRQVLAIVLGLLFMISAAAVVTVVVGAVGLWTVNATLEDGIAGITGGDEDHLRDTGIVPGEIVKKKPRPRAVAPEEPVEEAPPVPVAPTTGDGTIIVPTDILFRSIEVNCPQSGIRTRASFIGGKATARGLPLSEDCIVTFQGSQPAKAQLRGGQTKTCTFDPTNCR